MFELLKDYTGSLTVNNKKFESVEDARRAFSDYKGGLTIILNPAIDGNSTIKKDIDKDTIYQITVRKYMTNYGSDFFLNGMNKQGPMPYITMVGQKLSETEKLVKMKCWVELSTQRVSTCIRCGRPLTNPISQYLSLGPECGAAEHMKLIQNGVSVDLVRKQLQEKLNKITWTGWIIKTAIKDVKVIEHR